METVLENAGFESEFRKWIIIAVVQVNGKPSEVFAIELSVRYGCPLSPLLYVPALEPFLRRLRNKKANPALSGVPFGGRVKTKASAYADDITVFVSRHLSILAMKKSVEKFEVAGAKINFDKGEGLRLGACRGGVPLPWPFCWNYGSVRIGVWFGPGLQLERNCLEGFEGDWP